MFDTPYATSFPFLSIFSPPQKLALEQGPVIKERKKQTYLGKETHFPTRALSPDSLTNL